MNTVHSEANSTPNTDDEVIKSEEEEILVYVNVDDANDDFTAQDLDNFKVIGLDTDEPIIQVGDKFFGGSWDEVVGTAVFFKEGIPQPKRCYFSDNVPKPLKYIGKTQKSLNLRRAFVTNLKNDADGSSADAINNSVESEVQADNVNEKKVADVSGEEANLNETIPINDFDEKMNENSIEDRGDVLPKEELKTR